MAIYQKNNYKISKNKYNPSILPYDLDEESFAKLLKNALKKIEKNQLLDAKEILIKLLEINIESVDANYNMGVLLYKLNNKEKALEYFNKVLLFKTDHFLSYYSIGCIYNDLENHIESYKYFAKTLLYKNTYAPAYNNIGLLYLQTGNVSSAIEYFKKTLLHDKENLEAYLNLNYSYFILGYSEKAISGYDHPIIKNADPLVWLPNYLMLCNYSTNYNDKKILQEHKKFGKLLSKNKKKFTHVYGKKSNYKRKIRVGYISPDFKEHPVATFFKPLLKAHNQNKFEIFCYYNDDIEDENTKLIKNKSFKWTNITNDNDEKVAVEIYNDKIDILVDLAGHTKGNRLGVFVYKPAPIQISWLGYPNTSGIKQIDYRLVDDNTDPYGIADNLSSEKLLRLPNSFLCYEGPNLNNNKLPALENKYFTFGSLNALARTPIQVLEVWREILEAVPNSKIIIKSPYFKDQGIRYNYLKTLCKNNISEDRIVLFSYFENKSDHFNIYNSIDLCLDPFPYNGTTTSCDSLWMGVPFVTLEGNNHRGRVGVSILKNMKLENFIAPNIDKYIEIASVTSTNLSKLSLLRASLRDKMINSTLCDYSKFASNIEKIYLDIT